MRGTNRWVALLAALLVVATASCTNDTLDDGSSPGVYLEIRSFTNPPVTAQTDQNTGLCAFTVVDWSVGMGNVPVNSTATTSPFNDIILDRVVITYQPSGTVRTVGLGGISIRPGGTGSVNFQPVGFNDLGTLIPEASTTDLDLLFIGHTGEGEDVTLFTQRQLFVESCTGP